MSSPSEGDRPSTGAATDASANGGWGDDAAPAYPQVPPPPPEAVDAIPQRLHLAALGVWALGSAGPLIFLLVAGSLNIFNIFSMLVLVVVGAVGAVARWLRFTWLMDAHTLVIEQGVIQRQRRVIPFERIQSVEVVRKLRHRIFGVVELRVESIGGGGTEGQLDALSPQVAARLRRELLERGGAQAEPAAGDTAETPPGDVLVRMRTGQLVLAGVTGGRVGVVAALLGFASQAFGERAELVIESVTGFVGATGLTGALTAAAFFVLTAFVLSVAATTVAYWGFTLTRDARNLYTRRGLLDQRSGTIPLHRIQSVRMEENLVRRALGLAAVRVEVAGRAASSGAEETSTVLPIGSRRRAMELIEQVLERRDIADTTLAPMPSGARERRYVRALIAAAVPTLGLVAWLGAAGLAGLLLLIPCAALALAAYRALGHAELDGLVLARAGVLVRVTHVTPEPALQAVAVTSTPFQRRRGLATLVLHIARSPGGGGDPELIDLDEPAAHSELRRLAVASHEGARRPRVTDGPLVRAERDDDHAHIRQLHETASGRAREAEVVAAARASGDHDAPLSLVLEVEGQVAGHALLTTVTPVAADAPVAVLWPVAVQPPDQGNRRALVKAALSAAARQGAHRVLAADDPALLEPLGFEPAAERGMRIEDAGPAGGRGWMVRLLPADDGSAVGSVAVGSALQPG